MLKKYDIYIYSILLAIAINIFSWHLPFFWDTILTSTITQYFYENGFHNFITPAMYDAGHPPLFYCYVTCFYYLFGKALWVAHLSMLPFTVVGIVAFVNLLQYFSFSKIQQLLGVMLYFLIPAVASQNIQVSYDAVLLSLYLLAIVSYLANKKIVFALLSFLMLGITLRGVFCVAALSITIFFIEHKSFSKWLKWNLLLLPSILLISGWYFYHYTNTGWFFATNAEGWDKQRGIVDFMGLFKNCFSNARCFFDLGIVTLSILCFYYIYKNYKIDKITLFWLIPAVVFSVSFLPFTNPINHRYFLIVYVMMLLPVLRLMQTINKKYSILLACMLLLGNFQLYPVPISNGWDCTLAQLNYFKCMNMLNERNAQKQFLQKNITGTVFPLNVSLYQSEMKNDTIKMTNINGKRIDNLPFVLYANIGNDFSTEQINQLHQTKKWMIEKEFKYGFVKIILYKNKQSVPIN